MLSVTRLLDCDMTLVSAAGASCSMFNATWTPCLQLLCCPGPPAQPVETGRALSPSPWSELCRAQLEPLKGMLLLVQQCWN